LRGQTEKTDGSSTTKKGGKVGVEERTTKVWDASPSGTNCHLKKPRTVWRGYQGLQIQMGGKAKP